MSDFKFNVVQKFSTNNNTKVYDGKQKRQDYLERNFKSEENKNVTAKLAENAFKTPKNENGMINGANLTNKRENRLRALNNACIKQGDSNNKFGGNNNFNKFM